jgi:hypothetical protein
MNSNVEGDSNRTSKHFEYFICDRDNMSDARILALVRGVHSTVYIMMVASIFLLLYAGATGYVGPWLWVALGLLAIETAVFAVNGLKCPLTALAVRYGATTGYAFDTILTERTIRFTFRFFSGLMVLGLVLLALRWAGVLG